SDQAALDSAGADLREPAGSTGPGRHWQGHDRGRRPGRDQEGPEQGLGVVPPGKPRPALRLMVASAISVRPPDPLPPAHPLVETWRDAAGGPCAYAYESAGQFWMDWPGIARFSFDVEGREITAWPNADVPLADIERVHRRVVVPAACQRLGHEVLHASAVG